MLLTNKTNQTQTIHKINGESTNILPGNAIVIQKNKLYASELKRISKVFRIEKEKPVIKSTRNTRKSAPVIEDPKAENIEK